MVTFTGCMGETYFDSKPIGLWNFREKEGDCKGCTVRLVEMRTPLRSGLCFTKTEFYCTIFCYHVDDMERVGRDRDQR